MRQSKRCWVQLRMLNQSVLSWKLLSGGCSCHALYYISEILLLRLVLLLSIAGSTASQWQRASARHLCCRHSGQATVVR